MKCFNHAHRAATYRDSVPDSAVEGVNFNQAGYSIRYFCDECAEERRRNVGNTTRLESLLPKCPDCGEIATYQTPDGAYWDSWAHYWRAERV